MKRLVTPLRARRMIGFMLIDHLIYRVPDLAGAVAEMQERLGVRAQAGGQHRSAGATPTTPPHLSGPNGNTVLQ